MTNAFTFFRALIADPRRVAAIAPSSPALANAITAEITAVSAPVIELGPGTGVFTRALLARGVPEDKLALVEYGRDFARMLRSRYPRAHVLRMDAARLRSVELFGGVGVGAVVSGLPLLSMPANEVIAILDGAFAHLRPDAAFYQFTYGPRCPVRRSILERLGLKAARIGGALANMPPASVYRILRRPHLRTPVPGIPVHLHSGDSEAL
jgi:phospholipid N-methyltransferase